MLTEADIAKIERSAHRANIRQLCIRLAREAGARPAYMAHIQSVLNAGRTDDDVAVRAKLTTLQRTCAAWFF